MKLRNLFLIPALAVFLFGAHARVAAGADATIVGTWQAIYAPIGAGIRIIIHVSVTPEGKYSVTLDSPDQGGAAGIPLEAVKFNAGSLHFENSANQFSFTGSLSRDGSEIIGTFTQGAPSPMVFLRKDAELPPIPPMK